MALRRVFLTSGAFEWLAWSGSANASTAWRRVVAGAGPTAAAAAAAAKPGAVHRRVSTSTTSSSSEAASDEEERAKLASKLLYRARQRGFLELDLLVGLWAEAAVPAMDLGALRSLEAVLDEENPDLFKWLTGQQPAPERLTRNPQYAALQAHVARQLSENLHAGAAAAAGREWVRGWDDGSGLKGGGGGAAAGAGAGAAGASSGGATAAAR